MKPQLPIDTDQLLREMTGYLPSLYFPERGDQDMIHTLAREEFSRVQRIMRREYDTGEAPGDSVSPFDAVEEAFEQAVYARIRLDPNTIEVASIREEMIRKIRAAVEKADNIIGTFYQNRGVHFQHESESEEYDTTPIVVIHSPEYHNYGGYEADTVFELFINADGKLICTLNGESGESFDEPIEHVQVEGLLEIAHWLEQQGFIASETPDSKYAAWQRGERKMLIASIEIYRRDTNESSSGADNIFYDQKAAMEYFAEYFADADFYKMQDSYFVCSIRRFEPSLEERQGYPTIESLFDMSDFLSVEPYYVQTVNK